MYLNTTKIERHLLGTVRRVQELTNGFRNPVGQGHRKSHSVSRTLILVVSYYLLSLENSVCPRAPPTMPGPALPARHGLVLISGIAGHDTVMNWGHWATARLWYGSLLLAQETPRNATSPVHQCQTSQGPSPSAPWKVKVAVAWGHWPQPAPGFYSQDPPCAGAGNSLFSGIIPG